MFKFKPKDFDSPLFIKLMKDSGIFDDESAFLLFTKMAKDANARVQPLIESCEKLRQALAWYADGFEIMNHIEGTYTIHDSWYQKARATIIETDRLLRESK